MSSGNISKISFESNFTVFQNIILIGNAQLNLRTIPSEFIQSRSVATGINP